MKNKKMVVSAASAVIPLFSGLAFAAFDSTSSSQVLNLQGRAGDD